MSSGYYPNQNYGAQPNYQNYPPQQQRGGYQQPPPYTGPSQPNYHQAPPRPYQNPSPGYNNQPQGPPPYQRPAQPNYNNYTSPPPAQQRPSPPPAARPVYSDPSPPPPSNSTSPAHASPPYRQSYEASKPPPRKPFLTRTAKVTYTPTNNYPRIRSVSARFPDEIQALIVPSDSPIDPTAKYTSHPVMTTSVSDHVSKIISGSTEEKSLIKDTQKLTNGANELQAKKQSLITEREAIKTKGKQASDSQEEMRNLERHEQREVHQRQSGYQPQSTTPSGDLMQFEAPSPAPGYNAAVY